MHYRNGRVAKNGDQIIQLTSEGGKIVDAGILYNAVPSNDYCNGHIAQIRATDPMACIIDCIHADDFAVILAEKGLDKRPAGK